MSVQTRSTRTRSASESTEIDIRGDRNATFTGPITGSIISITDSSRRDRSRRYRWGLAGSGLTLLVVAGLFSPGPLNDDGPRAEPSPSSAVTSGPGPSTPAPSATGTPPDGAGPQDSTPSQPVTDPTDDPPSPTGTPTSSAVPPPGGGTAGPGGGVAPWTPRVRELVWQRRQVYDLDATDASWGSATWPPQDADDANRCWANGRTGTDLPDLQVSGNGLLTDGQAGTHLIGCLTAGTRHLNVWAPVTVSWPPPRSACAGAASWLTSYPGDRLVQNATFCTRTSEGRYAVLRVQHVASHHLADGALEIDELVLEVVILP